MYRDISRWYNYFRHAWRSDLPLPFANIRTAHRLLPKGRVGVICFEHLRLEPIIFFSRISAFLGISLEETLTHTKDTHRNYSLTSVQHKYLLRLLESNSKALGLSINVATESERAQFKALQESGSVFKVDLPRTCPAQTDGGRSEREPMAFDRIQPASRRTWVSTLIYRVHNCLLISWERCAFKHWCIVGVDGSLRLLHRETAQRTEVVTY